MRQFPGVEARFMIDASATIASSWEMMAPAHKTGSGWDTTPTRKNGKHHKQKVD